MSGRVSGSSFMPSQRDIMESSIQTVGKGRVSDTENFSAPGRAYFTRSRRSVG
jgi:hypothetical protein